MGLETVVVYGVSLDVYYDVSIEKDPYGTGDSPTSYEFDIKSIEAIGDTQDLTDLLHENVIESIHEQLIEAERDNG
jgi:hypothetical protein